MGARAAGLIDMGGGRISKFFSTFSNWLALWVGSHWAFTVALVLVLVGWAAFGVATTNIAISIATLLMVVVLQNTQNRDSAAIHLKLDEIITSLEGPRNEVAGIESGTHEEIVELRHEDVTTEDAEAHSSLK